MKYFAGWGMLLEQCFHELCGAIGQRPDFICDSDPGKHGKALHGISCIPFEAAWDDPDAEFFITVRKYQSIVERLKAQGHSNIHVVHFDRSYHKVVRISPHNAQPRSIIPFPSGFFQGKNILVTGASRGLGSQLAVKLASLGADLILHARETAHLEYTRNQCMAFGRRVDGLAADLESAEETGKLIEALATKHPRIDIIYNNAAISPPTPADNYHIPRLDFEKCFKVNALAPILIASTFIPKMLAASFGRIVNVSSSIQYQPLVAAYATSKAALDKFVFDLAPTLNGTNVAINLVDPGSLRTDMNRENGLHPVESALNGLLVAALFEHGNGRWISAQDYSNLSLDEAHTEAIHRLELKTI
jgi:NAD(P)-dependent dehydrogenase (short-subunit alcohol dehydrogenase family)